MSATSVGVAPSGERVRSKGRHGVICRWLPVFRSCLKIHLFRRCFPWLCWCAWETVASIANKHWLDVWGPEQGAGGARAGVPREVGFGERHRSPSPTVGFGGINPVKILNCNTEISAFWCFLCRQLHQIICTASTLFTIMKTTIWQTLEGI